MTVALPTLAVAFAAFCVWLMVRIVNRRERLAKWMLAAVVGLPVFYVASFGPACWITCRNGPTNGSLVRIIYCPIFWSMNSSSPACWRRAIDEYANLVIAEEDAAYVGTWGLY